MHFLAKHYVLCANDQRSVSLGKEESHKLINK